MSHAPTLRPYHAFYTVLMAFAVENAVQKLLSSETELTGWSFSALIAFILTAVPFYHGTISHWEGTYRDSAATFSNIIHADYYFSICHAVVFVGMAQYITDAGMMIQIFTILLLLDIVSIVILLYLFIRKVLDQNARITWELYWSKPKLTHDDRLNKSILRLRGWIKINLVSYLILAGGQFLFLNSWPMSRKLSLSLAFWKKDQVSDEALYYIVFILCTVFRFFWDMRHIEKTGEPIKTS